MDNTSHTPSSNGGGSGIDVPEGGGDGNFSDYGDHSKHTAKKVPVAEELDHAITEAARRQQYIRREIEGHAIPSAQKHIIESHDRHITWAKELQTTKDQPALIKEIADAYNHPEYKIEGLKPGASLEETQQFLTKKLNALTENVHQMRNAPNTAILNAERQRKSGGEKSPSFVHDATQAPRLKKNHLKLEEEAEKAPNMLRRGYNWLIEKHDNKFAAMGEGQRFGFAIAELALGSIATDIGSRLLVQSVTGMKDQNVVNDTKEEKGHHRAVILETVPMSTQERLLKGVLGGATAAAGISGTIMGFRGMMRGI